ncbi:MAG: endonuclease domain-containing protein [Natronosporangium sp.]
MNRALSQLVQGGHGLVTRRAALREVPACVWSYALRAGQLVPLFPGVAADPALVDSPAIRLRAALEWAGPDAALSHSSALAVWGLPGVEDGRVHLTTGPGRRVRVPGIVAHRRAGFRPDPPQVLVRDGLPVTRLEQSLVDAWPLATDDLQRAPLLRAVAERMTTPERVAGALADTPKLPGRAELERLLRKVAAGCRSELELYGYDHVFIGPGMPVFQRQARMVLGNRTVYLDVYDPSPRTTFELDGAKWRGSAAQRERDLRRDAALAARGIMVVRFSHDRLVREPDQVRREILAILAARRAMIVGRQ